MKLARFLVALVLPIGIGSGIALLSHFGKRDLAAGTPTANQEVMQKAIDKLETNPDWDRIEINRADGTWYRLMVLYRKVPSNPSEVESDTKTIVAAVVSEIIASGVDPLTGHALVSVWAEGPAQDKMDQGQVKIYAHADYNEYNRQIEFIPVGRCESPNRGC